MNEETMYEMARRIAREAAERYDPFERVEVRGPFEGSVIFSDGRSYRFSDGKAMIHRKNLNEAYNLGCKRTTRRRQE
jgi:hypothetical protein